MKKLIFLSMMIVLFAAPSSAQSFISITPDNGVHGQTLSTTVSGSGFFFTMNSVPTTWGDFYMKQGNNIFMPNWVSVIDNDNFTAEWTIPANIPPGYYDVLWDTWDFNGSVTYSVPGGFNVFGLAISGKIFTDYDSSGTQNGIESGIFNNKVMLFPDSSISFTDNAGNYIFGSLPGPKTVKAFPKPSWKHTTDSVLAVNLTTANVPGINFGMKGILDFIDIDASLTCINFPRCLTNVPFAITFTNNGTIPTHGEVHFTRSLNCTWVSSSIPYDNVVGNVYTWNYVDLLPGETRTIIVTLTLPGAGSVITNAVQVIARDDLNIITDVDEALLTQTVFCSYDPNDKSVIPEGVQAPHYTLMSDSLDFVIRFQNTGNDTAFKVVILDTLDKNVLDINTFEIIAYSHPVVIDLRTNGKVTFTFDNILLPDSNINEPGSHGFIRFRCMAKSGLPNNTVLNNTTRIYFDLNPPVLTNTTLNTLVYQIPVGISEANAQQAVTVMPNPVTDDAIISFSNPLNEKFELKVYDARGKLVDVQTVRSGRTVIDRKILNKGVYLFRLKNDFGDRDYNGKFIVL